MPRRTERVHLSRIRKHHAASLDISQVGYFPDWLFPRLVISLCLAAARIELAALQTHRTVKLAVGEFPVEAALPFKDIVSLIARLRAPPVPA